MQRSRLWVNFSKEYADEYFNSVKEENFSNLVCNLLREYYIKENKTDDYIYNKLDRIEKILEEIKEKGIIVNNDNIDNNNSSEDFEIW